ncbi:hypothetical protein [Methylobacterium sp. Leaf89]|uniref:hypothetical protein n=1 Tax=Methylobacterium sp. Leaf89 TaxID=1736245 RepID=UPI0012E76B8C|nr:hypothetical protein [Methylobacterium sp. Leaf89]
MKETMEARVRGSSASSLPMHCSSTADPDGFMEKNAVRDPPAIGAFIARVPVLRDAEWLLKQRHRRHFADPPA